MWRTSLRSVLSATGEGLCALPSKCVAARNGSIRGRKNGTLAASAGTGNGWTWGWVRLGNQSAEVPGNTGAILFRGGDPPTRRGIVGLAARPVRILFAF